MRIPPCDFNFKTSHFGREVLIKIAGKRYVRTSAALLLQSLPWGGKKDAEIIGSWPSGSGYLVDQLKRALSRRYTKYRRGEWQEVAKGEDGFDIAIGSATVSSIFDVLYRLWIYQQAYLRGASIGAASGGEDALQAEVIVDHDR